MATACLALSGCALTHAPGGPDASAPDAASQGAADASTPDAGTPDAAGPTSDAGPSDGGSVDAGSPFADGGGGGGNDGGLAFDAGAPSDGGWTLVSNGLYGGSVSALAVDPQNPAVIFAAASSGLFKSIDSGASWAALNANGLPSGLAPTAIAMDPVAAGTAYVLVGNTVYKSTDGGASWSPLTIGLPANVWLSALVVDPSSIVYASGTDSFTQSYVFKSANGGATWATTSAGLGTADITALAIDRASPSTLYGVGLGGLYRSTDGAATWSAIAITGLPLGDSTSALAIDPTSSSNLYLGVPSVGLYRSTNGGATWTAAGLAGMTLTAIVVDPSAPSTLYATASAQGVFKSTDQGATWAPANVGLSAVGSSPVDPLAIALNPAAPTTIVLGTSSGPGLFRTTNGGAGWSISNTGLGDLNIAAVAVDPKAPNNVYVGTQNGGFFLSTNGGGSWAALNDGLTVPTISSIAFDTSTASNLPSTVYLAGGETYGAGPIYKSVGLGVTWAVSNGFANTVLVDPRAPKTVYALVRSIPNQPWVYKSTDGAATWAPLSAGAGIQQPPLSGAIDPANDGNVYLTSYWTSGVVTSHNSGTSWSALGATLLTNLEALVLDPLTPATLYVGTEQAGIFKTVDSGATWSASNAGISDPWTQTLAINGATPQILYAGTRHGGIFKTRDGATTWYPVNRGLRGSNIAVLAVDPTSPTTVYAATWGELFKTTSGGE